MYGLRSWNVIIGLSPLLRLEYFYVLPLAYRLPETAISGSKRELHATGVLLFYSTAYVRDKVCLSEMCL